MADNVIEKKIKTRVQCKYNTAEAWKAAGDNGFIPLEGEFIIYKDADDLLAPPKMKVGNGRDNVNLLPFATYTTNVDVDLTGYATEEYVNRAVAPKAQVQIITWEDND